MLDPNERVIYAFKYMHLTYIHYLPSDIFTQLCVDFY
uniref:Uncharacterized protein n=1 Tax=Anguilla anguilla TaxID=7936 RepID=A0A0E9WM36_ANGAN